MRNKTLCPIFGALIFAGTMSQAHAASLSYDLTLTNDTTGNIPDGTPYVRVTIDNEGVAGLINFNVTILDSILSDNALSNFGLQSFGFNATDGLGLSTTDIIGLPSGWSSQVEYASPPPSPTGIPLSTFGRFDAAVSDGGRNRVDPTLSFSIDIAGDSLSDYILDSTGGSLFAAHIVGFNDLNPLAPADDPYDGIGACYDTDGQGNFTAECNILTSVWVGGGTAVVPVPAAVWLFGSGLIGLVGLARRKKA